LLTISLSLSLPPPVVVKTSVVPQANGSSYIELGNTKVICGVFVTSPHPFHLFHSLMYPPLLSYGPRQSHRQQEFAETGKLHCEFKFAPFSCQQRKGFLQDAQEKEISAIVEQALEQSVRVELFPKGRCPSFPLPFPF